MISEGRIAMTEAEAEAVNNLLSEHPDESVSISRNEPNEAGAVLVQIGDQAFLVDENGEVSNS